MLEKNQSACLVEAYHQFSFQYVDYEGPSNHIRGDTKKAAGWVYSSEKLHAGEKIFHSFMCSNNRSCDVDEITYAEQNSKFSAKSWTL